MARQPFMENGYLGNPAFMDDFEGMISLEVQMRWSRNATTMNRRQGQAQIKQPGLPSLDGRWMVVDQGGFIG